MLQGWNEAQPGQPIEHRLVVGDAYVRNVSTDIRSWGGSMEPNGNSIFIIEVAGLCIGHLGHLHHELTDTHYGEIGRLDILMVPVDGGLTLGADSMSRIVKRLRSAVVLPMHRRGPRSKRSCRCSTIASTRRFPRIAASPCPCGHCRRSR